MKKNLAFGFMLLLFFASCALDVSKQDAQAVVEGLLTDRKNENYSSLEKYYTDLANESEPAERKEEKFRQIRETTGPIKSFELLSAKQEYDSDKGINQMEMKYRVVCERVTVIESYLVINDGGKEKIIFQNIENER